MHGFVFVTSLFAFFCCYVNQQMGKDSQVRERGGCNLCKCLEFEREETSSKCAYCWHPPTLHQLQSETAQTSVYFNYCLCRRVAQFMGLFLEFTPFRGPF